MARHLRGKVVVITGASAGIGREAALLFAREGAHVVVAARRVERLQTLCSEIEGAGGRCLAVPTDVAFPDQVQRLLDATLEHFGAVDVWVNNAGYGLAGSVEQTSDEEMERICRVNYMGAFYGCRVALQQMRRQESGHIINVSSMASRFPLPLHAAYTASKAAMSGLSDSLSLELSGTRIHVTTVSPRVTETEFTGAMIKHIPDTPGHAPLTASARSVAEAIVRAAKHPKPAVMLIPAPPLALALFDLFPSLWRAIARRYIYNRTSGKGLPSPDETGGSRS